MSDAPLAPPQENATVNAVPWTSAMEAATEEEGYFLRLGNQHWAFFPDHGTTLLVSFETAAAIRARKGNMPLAQSIARLNGWSHLCLIAEGASWFRDPAVYAFFDRQVDDAFFEDFDHVLFYGAGMAGYAACAYSVASPGAMVLALNPRATLDPAEAGWDNRDRSARRLDFTSRYGYAPDMLEGAAKAVVIHDPALPPEAMQAALFRAPHVTRLSARYLGDRLEEQFHLMAILPDMLTAALAGKLDAAAFARLWRARRNHGPYLNALLDRVTLAGRTQHEMMICRSVTQRIRAPRFARRLARLSGKAAAPGDQSLTGSD